MQFSLWQALKLTINQFFVLRNNTANRSASAYAALAV
ncbi:hypothetical protein AN390_03296 [Pseudoalteromonas sp. P1-11]|nr:hypothetical protein AN390_03296 [Pseudoalteromonas sp. P1-11]